LHGGIGVIIYYGEGDFEWGWDGGGAFNLHNYGVGDGEYDRELHEWRNELYPHEQFEHDGNDVGDIGGEYTADGDEVLQPECGQSGWNFDIDDYAFECEWEWGAERHCLYRHVGDRVDGGDACVGE